LSNWNAIIVSLSRYIIYIGGAKMLYTL